MYKNQMNRIGLLLLAFMAFMILGLTGCSKQATVSEETPVTVGESEAPEINHEPEVAPNFVLKDLDGTEVSLSDYQGKFLMVNFWATWCQYCDEEMPDLMAFQEKHKDELTVLAINVGEDEKTVKAYMAKKKLDLKVLMDKDNKVAESFVVSAFPTTFLIDPAGKVIGYIPGKLSLEDMEGSFKYLKEQSTVK